MPEAVKREARWYFGGTSSALAITFTHPLDLIKVHLQTQQMKKFGFVGMAGNVLKNNGFLALYSGLSASFLRQIFYAFPRFGIYESYKNYTKHRTMAWYEKIYVAAFSGAIAGFMGNPADVINVRMQNDVKMPPDQRRNYKHVFDGIIKVLKNEGPKTLFNGVSMTTVRGICMTIGQVAGYDEYKSLLLKSNLVSDNPVTHLIAGIGAALSAIFLAQPFDVMKTRMMNASPGKYSGIRACAMDVFASGPLSFYKGLAPAFIRVGPHTVILFLIKEQLVKYFGVISN